MFAQTAANATNDGAILNVLSLMVTVVIGPLVTVIGIIVGFLIWWNRKQQAQLDGQAKQIADEQASKRECFEENAELKTRIQTLQSSVNLARRETDEHDKAPAADGR